MEKKYSNVKVICIHHGKQDIIMLGEIPVCTKCYATREEHPQRILKIVREAESNVIQFPRPNEDKDKA